jgi:hypothetical protein
MEAGEDIIRNMVLMAIKFRSFVTHTDHAYTHVNGANPKALPKLFTLYLIPYTLYIYIYIWLQNLN